MGVAATDDLKLASAVSRSHAGKALGAALGDDTITAPVFASAREALGVGCDAFVEYTTAASAKANVARARCACRGRASGVTDEEHAEIDRVARAKGKGVLARGNFAITMVLMQKFAELAAKYVPSWEIIDYAYEGKPDAPSGTARELATRLAKVRAPEVAVPVEQTHGMRDARGASLGGTQVHSFRLPGFVIGAEVIFGMPDQTLSLRHMAGSSAKPYVDGALLAIRKVSTLVGLHRGLDVVLEL